jgi:diguanylate cyclase (GGDEF)-like protein
LQEFLERRAVEAAMKSSATLALIAVAASATVAVTSARALVGVAFVLLTLALVALFHGRRVDTARLAAERRLARRDDLTGAPNRRAAREALESEHERIRRGAPRAALLLVDVDRFKDVNDHHGYAAGDAVLRELVTRLGEAVRKIDLVCRWGGEEFVVIAPATSEQGLRPLAEKLRCAVSEKPFVVGELALAVAVSIGATMLAGSESPTACLRRANLALQKAKQTRNTVSIAPLDKPELDPLELLRPGGNT